MSSAEFSLWVELYKLAPWDDTRGDINAAIVASTVANYAGKIRNPGSDAQLMDFMVFREREEVPETEPDPVEFFGKFI